MNSDIIILRREEKERAEHRPSFTHFGSEDDVQVVEGR